MKKSDAPGASLEAVGDGLPETRAGECGVMTSVVNWVCYDGSSETLPEEEKPVLLAKALGFGDQFVYRHDDGWAIFERRTGYYPEYPRKVGDLWAYLPRPPETEKGR